MSVGLSRRRGELEGRLLPLSRARISSGKRSCWSRSGDPRRQPPHRTRGDAINCSFQRCLKGPQTLSPLRLPSWRSGRRAIFGPTDVINHRDAMHSTQSAAHPPPVGVRAVAAIGDSEGVRRRGAPHGPAETARGLHPRHRRHGGSFQIYFAISGIPPSVFQYLTPDKANIPFPHQQSWS